LTQQEKGETRQVVNCSAVSCLQVRAAGENIAEKGPLVNT